MVRRNPLFPYLYRAIVRFGDATFYRKYRIRTMADATGRLLIIGLGPGHDLRYLPEAVTFVTAIEPDPVMRRMATELAQAEHIHANIVDAVAERIPFPDSVFDSVLVGLVLCSVSDVQAALAEIRRVLRPDGRLLVFEHVRGEGPLGRFQDLIAHPWSLWTSGCVPNRHTADALAAAGFDTSRLETTNLWPTPPPVTPHLYGIATPH